MNIGSISIIVKNGNIAKEKVDCIVVPEFSNCASYGGVGAAISACGMKRGLYLYDTAVQQEPLALGHIMITESGVTNIKLAHISTVNSQKETQFRVIFDAVLRVLAEAEKQGMKTIAIPELGTGVIGFLTQEQSARAIFSAVYQFSKLCPDSKIEEIRLIVFCNSTVPAETVLSQRLFEFKNEIGEKRFDVEAWIGEMVCNITNP